MGRSPARICRPRDHGIQVSCRPKPCFLGRIRQGRTTRRIAHCTPTPTSALATTPEDRFQRARVKRGYPAALGPDVRPGSCSKGPHKIVRRPGFGSPRRSPSETSSDLYHKSSLLPRHGPPSPSLRIRQAPTCIQKGGKRESAAPAGKRGAVGEAPSTELRSVRCGARLRLPR